MNRKLRIGVIGIEGPEAGGAHTAEAQMVSRLGSLKEECELVFIPSSSSELLRKVFGNKFQFLGQFFTFVTNNPASWFVTRRLKFLPTSRFERRIKNKKVDLVFFVGQYDLASKLRNTPYIVTIWDLGHRDLPEISEMYSNREFEYREWRIQSIAKKASYIVVDSEVTKKNLTLLYGLKCERIVSLPFVVKGKSTESVPLRESYALYPAHFWNHKNHSILLLSIHNLINRGLKPRELVLTGLDKGSKKSVMKLIQSLGIQDYVKFLGFVSPEELEELYKKAAVTVMPSLLGPTNLPPLESLSCGCPVVIAENSYANLEEYESVLVLNPFDLGSWSNIMTIDFKFMNVDQRHFNESQEALEEENRNKLRQVILNLTKIVSMYK